MSARGCVSLSLWLLVMCALFARVAFPEEPQEKRREEILENGTKVVHITRMFALSSERYVYAPNGSFRSHIAWESHPNGRFVCRRSYDEHGVLLAFQTYTYDRQWSPRAIRTFNVRGELVLYATADDGGDKMTLYTSDSPGRRVVQPGSQEYIDIVRRQHLEAFQ